jgi:hypothetical protein
MHDQFDESAVSGEYLRTCFATDYAKYGKPTEMPVICSHTGGRVAIPIYVDATGSTANYVFPNNLWSDNTAVNGYFN